MLTAIEAYKIADIGHGGNLLSLDLLLLRQKVLKLATHFTSRNKIFYWNQPAQLITQVHNRLQMANLPVEEAA